jgi:hypothetical protein
MVSNIGKLPSPARGTGTAPALAAAVDRHLALAERAGRR